MSDDPPDKLKIRAVIDGSNLFVTLRKRNIPTRLHYTRLGIRVAKKLTSRLSAPWVYEHTLYACSSPRRERGKQRFQRWREFQQMLGRTDRLEYKLGRLEGPRGATKEKGVDTIVTTALIRGAHRNEYDIAILIAADGDYAPAIEDVRAAGKKVFVAWFSDERSYHLQQVANGFLDITDFDFQTLKFFRKR